MQKSISTNKSKLIVKVQNEEEARILVDSINYNKELETFFSAKIPKGISKRVVLSEVPKSYSEEQLIGSIARELNCESSLLFIRKLSKVPFTFATYSLFLPELLASDLLNKERLYLDFHTIFVRRYVRIIRCFKCNCFGHILQDCKFDTSCTRCSQGHNVKKCSSKDLFCINCKSLDEDGVDFSHSADSSTCMVYRRLLMQQIELPSFARKNL